MYAKEGTKSRKEFIDSGRIGAELNMSVQFEMVFALVGSNEPAHAIGGHEQTLWNSTT